MFHTVHPMGMYTSFIWYLSIDIVVNAAKVTSFKINYLKMVRYFVLWIFFTISYSTTIIFVFV